MEQTFYIAETEKPKDFAIIHNTPKGQLLITREPEGDDVIITIWVRLEGNIGIAQLQMTIKDEDIADEAFEEFRDYENVKTAINNMLNQEYL